MDSKGNKKLMAKWIEEMGPLGFGKNEHDDNDDKSYFLPPTSFFCFFHLSTYREVVPRATMPWEGDT